MPGWRTGPTLIGLRCESRDAIVKNHGATSGSDEYSPFFTPLSKILRPRSKVLIAAVGRGAVPRYAAGPPCDVPPLALFVLAARPFVFGSGQISHGRVDAPARSSPVGAQNKSTLKGSSGAIAREGVRRTG